MIKKLKRKKNEWEKKGVRVLEEENLSLGSGPSFIEGKCFEVH